MVIIGVDPHPGSHTVAVMDPGGRILQTHGSPNTTEGLKAILELGRSYPERTWAIEGAANSYVAPLVRTLLALGEEITDVPPALTSQYRSRRGAKKNDIVDAENVARALRANPELPRFTRDEGLEELKRHSRTRQRLAKKLKSERMAIKELPAASPLREHLENVIACLEDAVREIEKRIEKLVKTIHPELLELCGVGPVVAGVLLAESGDVTRFKSADAFASYCGTAPIDKSSGKFKRVRVNPGGNRRLNWAMHIVATSRLRVHDESREYVGRKLDEGKTKRSAIRQLKNAIAKRLFKTLQETCHGHETMVA